MLPLFLFGCVSLFIPIETTQDFFLDVLSDKEFNRVRTHTSSLVLFIADTESEDLEEQEFMFSSLSILFPLSIEFVTITEKSAPRTFAEFSSGGSQIVFLENGHKHMSFSFPENEAELLSSVRFFTRPATDIIDTKEKLYTEFGDTSYTLVAPTELASEAFDHMVDLSPIYGPINVAIVTKELLTSLGFSGDKLCIYRLTDKFLTEVNTSILACMRPTFYPKLNREILTNSDAPIALLVYEGKPPADAKNILTELAPEYKKFYFGLLEKSESAVVKELLGGELPPLPFFIVCHFTDLFYYPAETTKPFSAGVVKRYLNAIEDMRMNPLYVSEPTPKEENLNGLFHLVGKTYNSFVNDAQKDTVVFYVHDETDQGLDFADVILDYFEKKEITSVKVGFINVKKNSVAGGFPLLISELHVELFPAGTKEHVPFIGSPTLYNFIRFMNKYSKTTLAEDESLFDPELEMSYLIYFATEIDNFVEESHSAILEYVSEMGYKLGFGNTSDEVISRILEMQGIGNHHHHESDESNYRRRYKKRRSHRN